MNFNKSLGFVTYYIWLNKNKKLNNLNPTQMYSNKNKNTEKYKVFGNKIQNNSSNKVIPITTYFIFQVCGANPIRVWPIDRHRTKSEKYNLPKLDCANIANGMEKQIIWAKPLGRKTISPLRVTPTL